MGRILCISNQKGGVGKTTTAINLAASLAAAERKTLLIDMDPQGNAGSGLGVDRTALTGSVYDALINGRPLSELVQPTELRFLEVVPATADLTGAEVELVGIDRREHRLKDALKALAKRLRLRPHRLPAVAGAAHRQRPRRGRRGPHSPADASTTPWRAWRS